MMKKVYGGTDGLSIDLAWRENKSPDKTVGVYGFCRFSSLLFCVSALK